MATTPPPIAEARVALSDARRYRAEWQLGLTAEDVTPLDLFAHAASEEGKPLRRLTLRQVLLALPGYGPIRTQTVLDALAVRVGVPTGPSTHDLTVAWLLDPRAGGKRFLCWLDATREKMTPWTGFPATPMPRSHR